MGVDIKEQFPNLDYILAPIGGGGLVAGLCTYFKDSKQTEIIGCQPTNASKMYESVRENRIVSPSIKESISGFEILDEEHIKKAVAFVEKIIKHLLNLQPTYLLQHY